MASCFKCQGPLQAPRGKGPIESRGKWYCWECFQGIFQEMVEHDAAKIRESPDAGIIPVGIPQATDLMDLAVARAIGLESAVLYGGKVLISSREWDEIRGIDHPTCEGDVACVPFHPCTDLDAAFAAAEKAGLFGDGMCLLKHRTGIWRVWDDHEGKEVAIGATPALVICAAILELKENQ